ncbi:MAG: hypothetical protein KA795_04830 [Burkholderiaceae bacterium]|nr:hypothetical protein [Burkholderiaceae bacterium]
MKFLQNALGPWGLLAAIGIYALLVFMAAGALFPRSQGLATILILALTLGGAWLLLGGGPPLQLLGLR